MDTISSTAQDYLKAIWTASEWGGAPITTTGLATRFGTTAATASDTIKRLTAQGLTTHEPYGSIGLTALGETHALQMVRRHRLIEAFLVTSLGYGWDEVHAEAENLEHSVSDLMVDRIDALLGHPSSDPHGDRIPGKDGRVSHPADARRASLAEPGEYLILRISDDDSERLTYFRDRGFVPGACVSVARPDRDDGSGLKVSAGTETLSLSAREADAIILGTLA